MGNERWIPSCPVFFVSGEFERFGKNEKKSQCCRHKGFVLKTIGPYEGKKDLKSPYLDKRF
jgi:hypothetical protein